MEQNHLELSNHQQQKWVTTNQITLNLEVVPGDGTCVGGKRHRK